MHVLPCAHARTCALTECPHLLVLQWAHSVLVRRTQTERAWSVIQDLQRRTCDVPAPRFQRSMGARGRALHKPSRPAGEHSLFNRPAQRAVDPPHLRRCQHSMGARSAPSRAAASQSREANDVPGSSTRTARTQSDVRSFRLDVWRIIIALRAATSLDLGRAALECGGGVSRASCVAVCPCTALHRRAVSLGVGSTAAGRPLLRASFDRGVARCTCGTVVFHTPIATFFSFCPVNARGRSCGASRKVCEQTWSPTNRRQESVS